MRHKKNHLDVKQEEHSNKSGTLCQKHNPETGNNTPLLDKVSPTIKQEPDDLLHRQSSDATRDVSKTYKEESTSSCKNETKEDSGMLIQKLNSDPGIPAQDYKPPLLSHLMKYSLKIQKCDLHLTQSPDSGVKTFAVCDGQGTTSEKREKVEDILLPEQSLEGACASQSDKQKLTQSTQPEKTSEKLQPRRNPDSGDCSSQSDQVTIPSGVSEKLTTVPKEEPQPYAQPTQCLDATNHASVSKEEKGTNTEGELVSQDLIQVSSLSIGVPMPQPGQENYGYSTKFEKVEKLQPRRNPDSLIQESQPGAESSQFKLSDKPSDDGYNWRKYGQKLVKGNKFIRSYYKCTYPNCQAKKQVERSHDGCKTDVNYLGDHYHQRPQQSSQATSAIQLTTPEMPIVSASKSNAESIFDHGGTNQNMEPTETSPQSIVARGGECVTVAISHSNNDDKDKDDHPDSKRQKREITSADDHGVIKSNCDLRHVVQTLSEVDIVNDGYRWRKYGQKLVKGNPNPRSYYRCSFAGCPVKKHVERASHDSKVVVTTYEGKHDHDMPPSRTINQSENRADAKIMTPNGESSSKREETNPVSHEMVVHVSAN